VPSNHRAVCVSFRSGGETVWFLPRGLLRILVTRLQRCRTLLEASQLHIVPSSNPPTQITHEGIFNSNCLSLPLCSSPVSMWSFVLSQPVTVTPWAPSPCSVTATAPATVARALSVTNVTNASWTISTTEPHTSVRNAQFATALSRNRWVYGLQFLWVFVWDFNPGIFIFGGPPGGSRNRM